MDRRMAMAVMGGAAIAVWIGPRDGAAVAAPSPLSPFGGADFAAAITRLEAASGGRLGLTVLDLDTGRRFSHRGGERFPLCSTFKFLLAANILTLADRRPAVLRRRIAVRAADIVPNSAVSARHVGRALTVAELCAATMAESDNTAANLLLPVVGGPAGLTRFVRGLGDDVTRQDNDEAGHAEDPAGLQDTTSPDAMLATMRTLLYGIVLSASARTRLAAWLESNRNGVDRLRAGLPAGWRVGDRTGTGAGGSVNDIAFVIPPRRRPLLVACYLNGSARDDRALHAIQADVGRAVATAVTGGAAV